MPPLPRREQGRLEVLRVKVGAGAGIGPEGVTVTRTLVTPLHVLKPGSLIAGKYRIIEEIGQGGMGVVYKAEDLKLKRCVAPKFMPPHLMGSPELKERFFILRLRQPRP